MVVPLARRRGIKRRISHDLVPVPSLGKSRLLRLYLLDQVKHRKIVCALTHPREEEQAARTIEGIGPLNLGPIQLAIHC